MSKKKTNLTDMQKKTIKLRKNKDF